MRDTTVSIILLHPDEAPGQARAAMTRTVVPACDAMFKRGVKRIKVTAEELEDERTEQQQGYYWGVILKDTSEQARIDGAQYTPDAWHELGKRLHLPRRKTKTRVAGRSRPVVTMTLGSTKGLGIRSMAIYMEKFIAWVMTDFGVVVSEPMPPHLRPQRRQKKNEVIDPDTGEVLALEHV